MNLLFLDWESKCHLDIEEVGTDNYLRAAKPLMLGWALNDEDIQVWFPSDPMPSLLKEHLHNPDTLKVAWFFTFERLGLRYFLGIDLPISEFRDVIPLARNLSLPGKLESVCEILKIGKEEAKIKDGKRLIKLFCQPNGEEGKTTLYGTSDGFNDPRMFPVEWNMFVEYCKRDVEIERKLWHKLLPFFNDGGWRDWEMAEWLNENGLPVHLERARKALGLAQRYKDESRTKLNEMTGLENANSRNQLLSWLKSQGYGLNSIEKKYLETELKNPQSKLTSLARQVLELRQKSSQNSYKKLERILAITSPDGRLRYQFIYLGAARTGRWCLAEGTRIAVKTEKGNIIEKNIETVDKTDMVWDGENWVSHDGVVCNGEKEVIFKNGITATPDHEIWISEKQKMKLGDLKNQEIWKGKPVKYKIYKITSPSGASYIGITSRTVKERWQKHIRKSKTKYNHPFHNAIRKYGIDNFQVDTIGWANTKQEACAMEIKFIAEIPPELRYNVSPGGEMDGDFGSKKFWKDLSANPEKKKEYLEKLSKVKKENDWSDYKHLTELTLKWRAENPRKAYEIGRRNIRIANKGRKTKNKPIHSLKDRLLYKYKPEIKYKEIAIKTWNERSPEQRASIGKLISEGIIKRNKTLSLKQKEQQNDSARNARQHIDRFVQGPAASQGVKRFWSELKQNPKKYKEYMERRTQSLMKTLEKKSNEKENV